MIIQQKVWSWEGWDMVDSGNVRKQWKDCVWHVEFLSVAENTMPSVLWSLQYEGQIFQTSQTYATIRPKVFIFHCCFSDLGVLEYRLSFCRGETLDFNGMNKHAAKEVEILFPATCEHGFPWTIASSSFFVKGWQAPELSVWCLSHLKQTS